MVVDKVGIDELKQQHQGLVHEALNKAHNLAKALIKERTDIYAERSRLSSEFDKILSEKKNLLKLGTIIGKLEAKKRHRRGERPLKSNLSGLRNIEKDIKKLNDETNEILEDDKRLRRAVAGEMKSLEADKAALDHLIRELEKGKSKIFEGAEINEMAHLIEQIHSRLNFRIQMGGVEFKIVERINQLEKKEKELISLIDKIGTEELKEVHGKLESSN